MPRATIFGAAALTALLLAGCTTSEPAPTEPGTTAEATSSPSPSPVESSPAPVVIAPERPAEMDDDGYQGAEAAAKYFLSLDDHMMKTGDTAEWEAMSHEECSTCTKRLEQARTIAENGDEFHGGEMTVEILHTYEQDEPTGIWPIDISVEVEPVTITNQEGDEVFSEDAVVAEQRIEVTHQRDRWVIVNVVGAEHLDRDDA